MNVVSILRDTGCLARFWRSAAKKMYPFAHARRLTAAAAAAQYRLQSSFAHDCQGEKRAYAKKEA